jgi:hypothetical protein
MSDEDCRVDVNNVPVDGPVTDGSEQLLTARLLRLAPPVSVPRASRLPLTARCRP